MKYTFILIIIFAFGSCKNEVKKEQSSPRDIQITELKDMKHYEIKNINSSYVGRLSLYDDDLYFTDKHFCSVQVFDKNLNLKTTKLRQGMGPSEIDTGIISGEIIGKESFFIDPDTMIFKFDKNFKRITQGHIKKYAISTSNAEENYDSPSIYTTCYSKYIIREDENNIYINIYAGYEFSGFNNSNHFKHVKPLLKINKGTFNANIIGEYSDYYKNGTANKLASFDRTSYDIDNKGNFIMSFEADSLINIYDNNFNHIKSFGYAGRKINNDYNSYAEFDYNKIDKERQNKGYYNWIEYIDQTDMTFRSYRKDKLADTYGLQIYDGITLIGDVDVPLKFRVIGYIKPYYYASGKINEDNEVINVYRFQL